MNDCTLSRLSLLFLIPLCLVGCSDEDLLVTDARGGVLEETTEPAKNAGPKAVPFTGQWINTENPPVPPEENPAGCALYITTSQVGRASHLGELTGAGTTCGYNPRIVDTPPFNLSGGAPPFFVADFTNEMTWTAANGDRLILSPNEGIFVQSLTDGTSSTQGALTVSGGTGRFSGATGAVDVRGIGSRIQFDGWISYEASNRRSQ